LEELYKVMC